MKELKAKVIYQIEIINDEALLKKIDALLNAEKTVSINKIYQQLSIQYKEALEKLAK